MGSPQMGELDGCVCVCVMVSQSIGGQWPWWATRKGNWKFGKGNDGQRGENFFFGIYGINFGELYAHTYKANCRAR